MKIVDKFKGEFKSLFALARRPVEENPKTTKLVTAAQEFDQRNDLSNASPQDSLDFIRLREDFPNMVRETGDSEDSSPQYDIAQTIQDSGKLKDLYSEIAVEIKNRTCISNENPETNPIDIEEDPIQHKIENFAQEIINELAGSNGDIDPDLIKAQTWLHFDNMVYQHNAMALAYDLKNFIEMAEVKKATSAQRKYYANNLYKILKPKYPELNKEAVATIIECFSPLIEKSHQTAYSRPQEIAKAYQKLWKNYQLGKYSKEVTILLTGTFAGSFMLGAVPSYVPEILEDQEFHFDAFAESVAVGLTGSITSKSSEFLIDKIIYHINQQMNEDLKNSIFYQNAQFLNDQVFAEKLEKILEGQKGAKMMLIRSISHAIPRAGYLVAAPTYLAMIHPLLGLINFVASPLLYFGTKKLNKKSNEGYNAERDFQGQANSYTGAISAGVVESRTAANNVELADKYKLLADGVSHSFKARTVMRRVLEMVQSCLFASFQLLTVGTAAGMYNAGAINQGEVASSMVYSGSAFLPMNDLIKFYGEEVPRYIRAVEDMYKELGDKEQLDTPDGLKEAQRIPATDLKNHNILVRDLGHSFISRSYRGSKEHKILSGINLGIKEGEFITIKGESGGGKSTFIKLLARVFEPSEGSVNLGADFDIDEQGNPVNIRDEGVNIEQIKKYGPIKGRYNSHVVSCVQDDPIIMKKSSLRSNLLFRNIDKHVPNEELESLLDDLGLGDFKDRLDDEKCCQNMSGGEKRRLELARTILSAKINSGVLLLDEATSNLDPKTAYKVVERIKKLQEEDPRLTVICISHDDIVEKASNRTINIYDINKLTQSQDTVV